MRFTLKNESLYNSQLTLHCIQVSAAPELVLYPTNSREQCIRFLNLINFYSFKHHTLHSFWREKLYCFPFRKKKASYLQYITSVGSSTCKKKGYIENIWLFVWIKLFLNVLSWQFESWVFFFALTACVCLTLRCTNLESFTATYFAFTLSTLLWRASLR